MTTFASPTLPLSAFVAALRRSWLAALAEAVVCALGTLLLGGAAVDTEMGVSLSPLR
jgi:hypothetical protein